MKTIKLENEEYGSLLAFLSRITLQPNEINGYVGLLQKIQKEAIAKPEGDTESKAD